MRSPGEFLQDLGRRIDPSFAAWRSFDAAVLKKIAVITMFLDHLAYSFLEVHGPDGVSGMRRLSVMTGLPIEFWDGVDGICRLAGRTAFPIFLFLTVEGYLHTRSRAKYVLRIFLFALLSYFPFQMIFFPGKPLHLDVMFTLVLGLLSVWGVDELVLPGLGMGSRRNHPYNPWEWLWRVPAGAGIAFLCAAAAKLLHTDYAWGGVLALLVLFVLRQARVFASAGSYVLLSFYNHNELNSIYGFLLLQCYNGRRGHQRKYFFYFFYPVHLALLLFIRVMIWGF